MKIIIPLIILGVIGIGGSHAFAENIEQVDEKLHFKIKNSDLWSTLEPIEGAEYLDTSRIGINDKNSFYGWIPQFDFSYEQSLLDNRFTQSLEYMPHLLCYRTDYVSNQSFDNLECNCSQDEYLENNCPGVDDFEVQIFEKDGFEIYTIDTVMTWSWQEAELESHKVKYNSMVMSKGLQKWYVEALYDLRSVDTVSNIESEVQYIFDNFTPITCNSNTKITISGEKNPLIKKKYTYEIQVENPSDKNAYVGVLHEVNDAAKYQFENNKVNLERFGYNAKLSINPAEYRVSGAGGSFELKQFFDNYTFSPGEFEIQASNGCVLETYPITIRDENWTETEIISVVPEWVKNNAEWWADGAIDDTAFIQAIQFLIKEDIISIDSVASSATESTKTVPAWVKNNAGWWAEGLISESDFLKGIKFLIQTGVISVT
tara:strand:- start:40 stop:1329 length:1290 start_codon:yes stop_codon:yes gene_type:complete